MPGLTPRSKVKPQIYLAQSPGGFLTVEMVRDYGRYNIGFLAYAWIAGCLARAVYMSVALGVIVMLDGELIWRPVA